MAEAARCAVGRRALWALVEAAAAQFQRMIAGAVEGDGIGVLELGVHVPFFRFVRCRAVVWWWRLPDAPLAGGCGGFESGAAAQFQRVVSGAVERDGVRVLERAVHSGLIVGGQWRLGYLVKIELAI